MWQDSGSKEIRKTLSFSSGMTLIEILSVAAISSFIVGVLFYVLNSGQSSWAVSRAKVESQSEARRSIDWITKDARQSVSWDLADAGNDPSETHIKFRLVQGYDANGEALVLASDYLEYTYDPDSHTITRRLSDASDNTLETWTLNNIMEAPFYTKDNLANTVLLNAADLLTSRKLIIRIRTQIQVKEGVVVQTTLTDEVKIRNE
jgi:type II secretory pathway component PulJ